MTFYLAVFFFVCTFILYPIILHCKIPTMDFKQINNNEKKNIIWPSFVFSHSLLFLLLLLITMISGRSRKMHPWESLLPFYKGFYLAGLTTAAYVVIKLFIVQSIFASKLALILGFYFVLEKIAMNMSAGKSTTTRKIVYHSEPQYVYPAEKEVYSLPQPTYSVSHTTGKAVTRTPPACSTRSVYQSRRLWARISSGTELSDRDADIKLYWIIEY